MQNAADVLKERRIAAGLTQVDLAKKVGVTKSTVFHWEHHGAIPRLDLQPLLNEVLSLPENIWLEAARQRAAEKARELKRLKAKLAKKAA